MSWTQRSELNLINSMWRRCVALREANGGHTRYWLVFGPTKQYLRTIFEINRPFVYIENVLDLWVQLVKNGGKNKSVVFIILFSEYVGLCMYVCMCVYTINNDILLFKSDSKDNVHNVAKYFYFNSSFLFYFYFYSLKNPDEIYNSPLIIWNVFELQIRIIGMISEVS